MKKILALSVVAAMFATSMFAFSFVGAGARAGMNFGAGTTLAKDYEDMAKGISDSNKGGNIGFGFGAYALFDLFKLDFGTIYLQPEVLLNFNNGYKIKESGYEYKLYSHTIDLPVLATIEVPIADRFEVGGGLGFQISLPVKVDGKISMPYFGSYDLSDSVDKITSKPTFGMLIDANGKMFFGSKKKKNIALVVDLRYSFDFTATKFNLKVDNTTTEEKAFTRRALSLTAGAEYRF